MKRLAFWAICAAGLPWVRLALLIRSITSTPWDEQTWPVVRVELVRALRMRAVVRREGWWN